MGRVLAIDYGKARLGVAISDANKCIALPRGALPSGKTIEESAASILHLCTQNAPVEAIVLGLPLSMKGQDSPMSLEVRKLEALLKISHSVILWDERLTSLQAEKLLKDAEFNRKKRSQMVDATAATLILQSYLDAKKL